MEEQNATHPEPEEAPTKKSSKRGIDPETCRILEALLFASSEPLTIVKLKSILPDNPDVRVVRSHVQAINEKLQQERHPFEVVEISGGLQFRTVAYYQPWVQKLFKEKAQKKLSIQALECMAIIAYKQPITKAEIEAIRGVMSDGAMKTLLEKRLVTIAGRSDKPGRPLLYGTTSEFLGYFGLNSLKDLPRIEEFEELAREKMNELTDDELQQINALPAAETGLSDESGVQEDVAAQELQDEQSDVQEKLSTAKAAQPTAENNNQDSTPEN